MKNKVETITINLRTDIRSGKMVNKDRIEVLLQKLDVEIGSTITFINDEKTVLENMKRANIILSKLKSELDIEF